MTAADLVRMVRELGHGDPRCRFVGPSAVRVFCPKCQPDGPRFDGDEPHLIVAIQAGGPNLRHEQ